MFNEYKETVIKILLQKEREGQKSRIYFDEFKKIYNITKAEFYCLGNEMARTLIDEYGENYIGKPTEQAKAIYK